MNCHSALIGSIGLWILGTVKLQGLAEKSVYPETFEKENLLSALTEQSPQVVNQETRQVSTNRSIRDSSVKLNYPSKPPPILIAAPENFNPGLQLPQPSSQPQIQPNSPPTSTESITPAVVLESITIDFRRDEDNFDQRNQFIRETAQFRLPNGNRLRFKTGFNSFEKSRSESINNIPLQAEWEGKIDQVTLTVGGGVDLFNRLPTALNLNAKVEAPIAIKVSSSGQLESGAVVSAEVEQGAYKFNAQTLDNQITAWRYGPNIYWQIDPKTSLYSSLRLGSYNDGNFEQQSFSRLERKIGQFSVAANLFNWSYTGDREKASGYFSPPDFLVYNGEVALQGNLFENLSCRLAATLGQQRLRGKFDEAYSYQARCTTKLSTNVEADFGYAFSNVRNQNTGGSAYNNQSFTGQLRVKF
ncbi:MAG: hypothetical protein ICV85_21355 [Tolypothrix sp. T3-bin4]|nr:hypothetical protein [Tolypothrix sp. T3-bin4]